jgi:hypothetical protein
MEENQSLESLRETSDVCVRVEEARKEVKNWKEEVKVRIILLILIGWKQCTCCRLAGPVLSTRN